MTERGLVFVCALGCFPVTNLFDVDGDETDDPEMACTVVAMQPDGQWLASTCRPGDFVQRGQLE